MKGRYAFAFVHADDRVTQPMIREGNQWRRTYPIVGVRIRQAARRGAQLIVIDPRRIELAADAACHLALKPGTNVALLNAMAHVIVSEGLCAGDFLEARLDGVETFRRFIAEWTPTRAAPICGIEADAIRFAARLFATHAPAASSTGRLKGLWAIGYDIFLTNPSKRNGEGAAAAGPRHPAGPVSERDGTGVRNGSFPRARRSRRTAPS